MSEERPGRSEERPGRSEAGLPRSAPALDRHGAPLRAIVLAAGFGTRMLPLTRTMPKALLPVAGRPLLEWTLRLLARSGIDEAVVNAHHHAAAIRGWIEQRRGDPRLPRVDVVVEEPEILGSAGGIANAAALGLLQSDPIVVANSDQILRVDLRAVLARHLERGAIATLVCSPHPLLRQVRVAGERVTEILPYPMPTGQSLYSFTGIWLLAREGLEELPRGRFEEIGPHWRRWVAADRVAAVVVKDAPFREAGTPEAWLEVERAVGRLREEPPAIEESIVLPGASVAPGARVRRSILGPDAVLSAGEQCYRRIVAAGESRALRVLSRDEEEALRAVLERSRGKLPVVARTPAFGIRLLAGDGSNRRFARLLFERGSLVAILNPPGGAPPASVYPHRETAGGPDENDSYLYVQRFLAARGVRVPAIHAFDRESGTILLEDLGDRLLLEEIQGRDEEALKAHYRQALEMLERMQAPAPPAFDAAQTWNVAYDEAFVLRFEAGYFHREMVESIAGLAVPFSEMEGIYRRIAQRSLAGAPRVAMHRDFQSRNLMIVEGGLALLDLQGMRLGPPEYDLASLLLDPYADLPARLREELLEEAIAASAGRIDRGRFVASGIDRMMQALGAYAYLGGRLGKPGFLEHAPVALRRLRELAEEASLPEMAGLADRVTEALTRRAHREHRAEPA
ncbi:MAG: phosphotransferase [Candidatus Eisenbacteria bacterium]